MSGTHSKSKRSFTEGLVSVRTTTCAVWLSVATIAVAAGDVPIQGPINQLCPVMPEEPVDSRFTLEFEGRKIGFCCEKCVAKFAANPQRYRDRLLELVSESNSLSTGSMAMPAHPPETKPGSAKAWRELLGRYHPVFVHFPIACAPIALVGFSVWLGTKNPSFAAADAPPLMLGGALSILAVVTGNIAEDSTGFGPSLQKYLEWHEFAGTTLMILTLALCGFRIWRWRRHSGAWLGLYGGGLAVASLVAGIAGFLGGTLVFGTGHLWP